MKILTKEQEIKMEEEFRKYYENLYLKQRAELEQEFALKKIDVQEKPTADFQTRLVELEVKMAKLYALLVEVKPSGKESLTKMGRKIYGGKKL